MLSIALKEAKVIDENTAKYLRQARVPAHEKIDPELSNLDPQLVARKEDLLSRGLSTFYVGLCLEAWTRKLVSAGRVAEMLLVDDFELWNITDLFGLRPATR